MFSPNGPLDRFEPPKKAHLWLRRDQHHVVSHSVLTKCWSSDRHHQSKAVTTLWPTSTQHQYHHRTTAAGVYPLLSISPIPTILALILWQPNYYHLLNQHRGLFLVIHPSQVWFLIYSNFHTLLYTRHRLILDKQCCLTIRSTWTSSAKIVGRLSVTAPTLFDLFPSTVCCGALLMVVSTKLPFAHFAIRNFQSVTSRLEEHLSVDNDGSNTGDDFEVVITPPEIGWPRQVSRRAPLNFWNNSARQPMTPDQPWRIARADMEDLTWCRRLCRGQPGQYQRHQTDV